MRDIKYIIKRIIIGVGIALVLGFLRGGLVADTYAMTVSAVNEGNSSYILLPQSTWYMQKSLPGLWSGWGPGYVYFNFSVNKVAGTSTEPVVGVRSVLVANNSASFVCTFGSASSNNSTWEHQVYSAVCPVNLTDSGLVTATVNMQTVNGSYSTSYEGIIDGHFTFVNDSPNVNVNVDNSGSNANRDANFGNLITDNRANTQYITNNDNNNTNRIIQSQENINNSINSTDTTEADSKANDFFGNFQTDSHGLSGIITAPLRLVNSLTTATCNPLEFDLPIVHNHVSLPCMRPILENHFGIFFSLWQLITTGLISYNVCINLYSKVRALQNPNNDRIEVLNL